MCAVVSQFFITEAENEYVIKGNSAIMKCKIPSFVADFVTVEAWINVDDGTELTHETSHQYGAPQEKVYQMCGVSYSEFTINEGTLPIHRNPFVKIESIIGWRCCYRSLHSQEKWRSFYLFLDRVE